MQCVFHVVSVLELGSQTRPDSGSRRSAAEADRPGIKGVLRTELDWNTSHAGIRLEASIKFIASPGLCSPPQPSVCHSRRKVLFTGR